MRKTNPKMYLGIDWGAKKIGLSLGDDHTNVAVPWLIVKDLAEVLKLLKKEAIDIIVVGEPKHLAGKSDSKDFAKFLEALKSKTKLPIELIDERLSTRMANRLGYDKKLTVGQNKKVKKGDDAVAAMIILQSYFDLHE
jgi:putative Holliday junction resolvase